jgi:hypothetical protein
VGAIWTSLPTDFPQWNSTCWGYNIGQVEKSTWCSSLAPSMVRSRVRTESTTNMDVSHVCPVYTNGFRVRENKYQQLSTLKPIFYQNIKTWKRTNLHLLNNCSTTEACDNVVSWGKMLQAAKSWARIRMRSLDLVFIEDGKGNVPVHRITKTNGGEGLSSMYS